MCIVEDVAAVGIAEVVDAESDACAGRVRVAQAWLLHGACIVIIIYGFDWGVCVCTPTSTHVCSRASVACVSSGSTYASSPICAMSVPMSSSASDARKWSPGMWSIAATKSAVSVSDQAKAAAESASWYASWM